MGKLPIRAQECRNFAGGSMFRPLLPVEVFPALDFGRRLSGDGSFLVALRLPAFWTRLSVLRPDHALYRPISA